jgi:hypothetical protein
LKPGTHPGFFVQCLVFQSIFSGDFKVTLPLVHLHFMNEKVFVLILLLSLKLISVAQDHQILPADTMIDRYARKQTQEVLQTLPGRVFIKAELSKQKIYIGEAVSVTYQLYSLYDCEVEAPVQPYFSNCSIRELSFSTDISLKEQGGLFFRVKTLRRVEITPLLYGLLVIDSSIIPTTVLIKGTEYPYSYHRYKTTVRVPPLRLTVSPYPESNKPNGFSNITGTFTIQSKLSKAEVTEGSKCHLIVTVSGVGNLADIAAPKVQWPDGFDLFETSDSIMRHSDSFPSGGEKVFDYPFIVRKTGIKEIPGVTLSFFNPKNATYASIRSTPVTLNVVPRLQATLPPKDESVIHSRKYLWIIPFIAVVVLIVINIKSRKKIVSGNTIHLRENTQNKVNLAMPKVWRPIYYPLLNTQLSDEVYCETARSALAECVQYLTDSKNISENEYEASLRQVNADESTIFLVRKVLEQLHIFYYAPSMQTPDKETIHKQLIQLETILKNQSL